MTLFIFFLRSIIVDSVVVSSTSFSVVSSILYSPFGLIHIAFISYVFFISL